MNDELPKGWTEVEFDKLNSFVSQTIEPSEYPDEVFELYSVPTFPTRKPELLLGSDIGSTKQAVEPDDVLICKINPRINRVWKVLPKTDKRQIASSEWIVMRAKYMNADFLRHYFSSPAFREILCNDLTGVGGSLTRAQPKRVAKFQVPVAPLTEQKRIAEKLEELLGRVDSCRARLDHIPDFLIRFRQSILTASTSGHLTREWRVKRFSENKRTDGEVFRWVNEKYTAPESWETATFEELASLITSGSRGWADYYSAAGAIFIRAQNINSDRLVLDDVAYVSLPDKAEGKRAFVERNDLLVTITGANVGKSARVKVDLEEAYISQHIALVKPKNRTLAPFLELFLQSENAGRWQLNEAAYGGGKPGLNLQNLRELVVALPTLEEQEEIVRRVEALFVYAERIESRVEAARAQVARLTVGTLKKAFRGRLVGQDPNDEPTTELLRRLSEHRAISKQSKHVRIKGKKGSIAHQRMKNNETKTVLSALKESGKRLSTTELFMQCGYPSHADTKCVESFFVELRETLNSGEILKERDGNEDFFTLKEQ